MIAPLQTTLVALFVVVSLGKTAANDGSDAQMPERQVTSKRQGHILTNSGIWSPDSRWIVYDTRSDAAGEVFDGTRIERVNVETGQVELIYESTDGANCGVATYCTTGERVVFIHGPESPTDDWKYAAYHRRGVLTETGRPGVAINLDARELVAPFKPGALRGGTHVHTFHGKGDWVAFTYEDHVLATSTDRQAETNLRNIGVSIPDHPVNVSNAHPRNHSGSTFTVLVTRTVDNPVPGSDEISRAFSDAWVGKNGYVKKDGTRQARAIAFQGLVTKSDGEEISEVFVVDIPEDVTQPSHFGPLQGTLLSRPSPPSLTAQRRLTFTSDRTSPGIQGPRHWLRSSPDGSTIACLMRDDRGIVQIYSVAPTGGPLKQVTRNEQSVASAFSWDPNGRFIAYVMDQHVCITSIQNGKTIRLTEPSQHPLRPESCVVSPNGQLIGYVRRVVDQGNEFNQIFVVPVSQELF